MERTLLEQIAFDMVMGGMEYNGEADELWRQVREASDEDLINWIVEE